MIYLTGDTHADLDISKLNTTRFPQQKSLTKDDYVIICGDFGLCWSGSNTEKWWLKWLSQRSFTTLWIDGNHENFDRLYQFPTEERFGGVVRQIAPDIYHIPRGQVLTLEGRQIFFMGGARSIDRHLRREHVSWWPQEMPTPQEMEAAVRTLERHDWQVDYVVTHCAPRSIQLLLSPYFENDPMVGFLERVRQDLSFTRWFFGHYHMDRVVNEQFVALYQNVIPLATRGV